MKKEYVIGGFQFSDGGEQSLVEDVRYERLLNNSFGLIKEQFRIVEAIATGQVTSTEAEVNLTAPMPSPHSYCMFQPAMRARQEDKPPIRDYLVIYCVNTDTMKIRKIYIRASEAGSVDEILKVRRAYAFIKQITELLETQPVVEVQPRPLPRRRRPDQQRERSAPRRPQPQTPYGATMANAWPEPVQTGRRDNRDRRHNADD